MKQHPVVPSIDRPSPDCPFNERLFIERRGSETNRSQLRTSKSLKTLR